MTNRKVSVILKVSFNVEMPAAGSVNPCPAVEEVWRTSTTLPYCVTRQINFCIGFVGFFRALEIGNAPACHYLMC